MFIQTPRLILQQMSQKDFPSLHQIWSDPQTMQFYPHPFTKVDTENWINKNIDRYNTLGFGLWTVSLKNNMQIIGDCGLTLQNINGIILPEIGYHINKKYWRQGYAKEAAQACVNWAFANTTFKKVYSYMLKDNIPSSSTAKALGMVKVDEYFDNEGLCHEVYQIQKEA